MSKQQSTTTDAAEADAQAETFLKEDETNTRSTPASQADALDIDGADDGDAGNDGDDDDSDGADGDDLDPKSKAGELALLKKQARMMNIKHSGNIGVESLRKKIAEALGQDDEEEAKDEDGAEEGEAKPALSKSQRALQAKSKQREELRRKAFKLVRCRIACMNPDKASWTGEIITAGNGVIGVIKKLIPFGDENEDGYHIPEILLNVLRRRTYTQKRTRMVNGKIKIITRELPEFSIEVLPPLTKKELEQLANRQAAERGMAE